MFKFSNSTPWKRGWLGIAASNLSSLVFALVFSFVSMSVLLLSDEALAVDDCGVFQKHSTSRAPSNQRINCGIPAVYQPGSERDDRGFPLTADENGAAPSAASDGNIVYSMSEFIVVQKYTPDGATEAVNRPWWQARCFPNNDADTQMCWTTVTGTVTPPSDPKKIYYRMVDDDGTPDRDSGTGDYAAGPATGTYGSVKVATVIGIPDSDIDQVATQKVDPSDNSKLVAADHNQYFLNATSPMYGNHVQINLGFEHGATIRGIKERVYLDNGIPGRVPRSYPTDGGQTYDGPDEDGFGRYAVKWDVSTSIGVRLRQLLLFTGGRGDDGTDNTIIEGGADKVSIIEHRQINPEGGSKDGGGIDFGGDGNEMVLRLGVPKDDRIVRTTVIARSAGEDSSFHAVHLHQDTQRGGVGEIRMVDTTILMLNGGDTAPEEGRGKIVTTGDDSSGITISVANPVGDDDEDGEPTGGIEVQVNTPVTIKTSGARSHGIVLNLGYDTDQAKLIEALEQRAAVLLEASHRDTALRIGMNQGTVHKASNNLLISAGYTESVRIATNGDKSGGIVIRNSGAAEEGGAAVQLVGTTSYAFVLTSSDLPNDLADYSLVVDKQIVTAGTGSHGVKASIVSGITMVVDIEDLGLNDDPATTDVDESATIRASGAALSGAGDGAFTVNVKGNVKGDIVTGSGDDTITVGFIDEDDDDNNKSPTITGDIDSGAGCDTVDLKAGVKVGGVSLGGCDRAGAQNMLITPFDLDNVEAGGNSKLDLAVAGGTDRMFGVVTVLEDPDQENPGDTAVTVDGGTVGSLEFKNVAGHNTKVVVGTDDPVTIGKIVGRAGNDKLTLNGATVSGTVNLGDGHDTLEWGSASNVGGTVNLGGGTDVVDGVSMTGTIDGGEGTDTVTLRSGTVSMIGVEVFNKMGAGMVMVEDMRNPPTSSSSLSGSTADAGDPISVNVDEGRLVVSGLLHLGSTGTLTVKKYGLLSIDIGGMSTQRYEDDGDPVGTLSHGRIIAGQVVMEAALPQIELISGSDADNAEAKKDTATTLSRLVGGDVKQRRDGPTIDDKLTFTIGSESLPKPRTSGGGQAADDDNTAIYAVGALAVLWWVMRRDDMGGGSGLVDYESGTADSSFAGHLGLRTHSSGAVKTWANYYSDSTAPVQGLVVGLEAPISSHGSFSFSAMPEAKGSLSLNTLSLNQKSSFQGGHYSVKGKWQSEDYFAAAELSYTDVVSSTSFDNPVAGGQLGGKFDMTGSHLEISAGAKVQLTDKVSVVPTVGVYGGSVSQSESVLTGRSVVAQMSKQEQSYAGWNLGLRVRRDAWTAGGAEFQPNFSLNTFRTSSDSRSLDLRQSDKAGVLDFSSQLPVQGMPAVVNAFRAGMTMKSETGLQLDLDYVGMEIDGELQHGAIARMQTRF